MRTAGTDWGRDQMTRNRLAENEPWGQRGGLLDKAQNRSDVARVQLKVGKRRRRHTSFEGLWGCSRPA